MTVVCRSLSHADRTPRGRLETGPVTARTV
jgi:hypothetical protein